MPGGRRRLLRALRKRLVLQLLFGRNVRGEVPRHMRSRGARASADLAIRVQEHLGSAPARHAAVPMTMHKLSDWRPTCAEA